NLYVPQWSADSTSVVVAYDASSFGRLNVTTGVLTPLPTAAGCCFSIFSPDGAYAVLATGATLNVVHADGSSPVPIVLPAGQAVRRLQSLSPDGHHMIAQLRATGTPGGDAGRVLGANTLFDTVTGGVVPMPDGGTLKAGFYRADGNAVLRMTVGGVDK